MTQGTNVQQKWGGGELDDVLEERYDIQQYDSSIGPSLNIMCTNKGDLIRRPGSEVVIDQISGKKTRIIPFIFSNGEAYRLEFTDLKLRIYQGTTQVTSTTRFTFDSSYYGPSSTANHYAGGENPHTFPYQVGDQFAVDSLSTGTWNIEYDPGNIATTGSAQFEVKSINYTQLPGGAGAAIVDDIRIQEIGQTTELSVDLLASTLPASIYWEFTHTEWTSPYTEAELQDIQFDGVGDLMFFTHENHQPMKLSRLSTNDFLFHPHFTLKGPWKPLPTYGIEWDVDAVAGLSVQDKGTQADCTPEEHIQELDHNSLVGRMVRITDHPIDTVYKRTWAVGRIVSVSETDDILNSFRATIWWEMKRDPTVTAGYPGSYILGTQIRVDNKRVDDLRIGYLFEDAQADGTGGWPRCVAIWENRLVYGGSSSFPTTFAFSRKGDFDNFESDDRGVGGENPIDVSADVSDFEVRETDGFVYTLQEGDGSQLVWIKGTPRGLMAATEQGVHISAQPNSNSNYSALNFEMKIASEEGSCPIQPVYIDGRVFYIGDKRNRIYSLGYNFSTDVYEPEVTSIFSDHLMQDRIESIAFARDPIQVLWMTTATGYLLSLVILKEQNQLGLFRHRLGGPSDNSSPNTYVHSLCVLPNTEENPNFDQLYMAVDRDSTIAASTIDRLSQYPIGIDMAMYNGLDCAVVPSSTRRQITAVTRTTTTTTITVAGHGESHPVTFALGGFRGDLAYLNSGALYTSSSVTTDTITFTTGRTPPDGASDLLANYNGEGFLYTKAASLSVSDGRYAHNPDAFEKGGLLTEDTDYSDSAAGNSLDWDTAAAGYIYSVGWAPDVYLKTLANVQNNQLGQAQGFLGNVSQLVFKVKETRGFTVKRLGGIEANNQSVPVISKDAETVGEGTTLYSNKFEVTPEQVADDRDMKFLITPDAGYPFRLLSLYKRGERAGR